jgi:hypothetical protein
MSINQKLEKVISHIIYSQKNIDIWEEYEENLIRNFELVNFKKIIKNYKPCTFRNLYISVYDLSGILQKNIILNDNLFVEKYENSVFRCPKKECDFTENDFWELITKCSQILVKKQQCIN